MSRAMRLRAPNDREGARAKQGAQISIAFLCDAAKLLPLEFCFGTSPIQAEKSRPDRKTFGSARLATSAVATAPTSVPPI